MCGASAGQRSLRSQCGRDRRGGSALTLDTGHWTACKAVVYVRTRGCRLGASLPLVLIKGSVRRMLTI